MKQYVGWKEEHKTAPLIVNVQQLQNYYIESHANRRTGGIADRWIMWMELVNAAIIKGKNTKKAIEELNLPQTPIEYAIKDALSWFKESNII